MYITVAIGALAWAIRSWLAGYVDPAGLLIGSATLLAILFLVFRHWRRARPDGPVLTLETLPRRASRSLAILAGYLECNSRETRVVGGRQLSGTDLVPHELWPLAGPLRVRLIAVVVAVLLGAPWLYLTVLAVTAGEGQALAWLVTVVANVPVVIGVVRALLPWPRPVRLFGLRDLTSGLLLAWVFGLVMGAFIGNLTGEFVLGLGVMALATAAAWPATGASGIRYLALVLCSRLPWRLGRFLAACERAGILRTAGDGYRFRDPELQHSFAGQAGQAGQVGTKQ